MLMRIIEKIKENKIVRFLQKMAETKPVYRVVRVAGIILGTVLLFLSVFINGHSIEVNAEKNVETGIIMTMVEWERLTSLPSTKNWRGAFLWPDNLNDWAEYSTFYYNLGTTEVKASINRNGSYKNTNALEGTNIDVNPYMFAGPKFVTRDYAGACGFEDTISDGDNKTYRYRIRQYTAPNNASKWYWRIKDDNTFDLVDGKKQHVSICQYRGKRSSSSSNGQWSVFWNESWGIDGHYINTGRYIGGIEDKDWPFNSRFYVYRAQEKRYTAITTYTVPSGQTQRVNSDVFQLDNSELTIADNAVLSIEGNFFYNGSIKCYGTIILQRDAIMMPYAPTSSAGNIELLGGGTIIIMEGARLMAGIPSGCMGTTQSGQMIIKNGNIYNYGILAVGNISLKDKAVIENHPGAQAYLGYGVRKKVGRFYSTSKSNVKSASSIALEAMGKIDASPSSVFVAYNGSKLTAYSATQAGSWEYDYINEKGKRSNEIQSVTQGH